MSPQSVNPSSNNKLRNLTRIQLGLGALAGLCFAAPFVYDGPPLGDPSAWTDLVIGTDPHDGPVHMNQGAYEGGLTGTAADTTTNNSRDGSNRLQGGFDIPSGGTPSPLYGAQSFDMQMLRFEEFGLKPMETQYVEGDPCPPPLNGDPSNCPDGQALDDFMSQPIFPEPTCFANCTDQNPWKTEIEAYLGHTLANAPCEGRPEGEGWSHQRWDEFPPLEYFVTAQNGARDNTGFRDAYQLHGYSHGAGFSEFGPGGLYHNTAGVPGTEGTTAGIPVKFHPAMPLQDEEALWTWDGTFPPKLLNACYGKSLVMRHYNCLPIDVSANRGFGVHTLTTHEHNGHNPAESDGYANAFFFPGQFFDYRWPMLLAGNDSINTDASDPRAGCPDGIGGIINVPGDFRETMSTHWFHDHMLDFTAQNVYKGSAAMMNYYSSLDRGNEALNDGVNLRLPSGSSLDWGNRDYDVNLLIACKAWDDDGQLWYNPFQNDGFLGDLILTNWCYHPYMDVRARKYRLRLLNGSVARYFKFALVQQVQGAAGQMPGPAGSGVSYNRVPFHLIANDGNIMAHAIHMDGTAGLHSGELPVQAIAERFDIIVDFSQFAEGAKLYMVNLLEHEGGRGPEDPIQLEQVLSEAYKGVPVDMDGDGKADRYEGGDPTVGRFMEFRVNAMEPGQVDLSLNPEDYEPGGLVMLEQPIFTDQELQSARRREFEFGRSSGSDDKPWTIKNIDGAFNMDPRRLTAAPNIGDVEIWTIKNNSGGWSHPVHIHFEEGKILQRDERTPPLWERYGRKDVFRVGPEEFGGQTVEVAIRFREFAGTYMEHCHNTTHEDTAMLMRWDIEYPGQVKLMPAPLPTWGGMEYVDSFMLEHGRVGDNNVGPGDPGGGGGGGGHADPVAIADSGQVFAGQSTIISLLANDVSFGGTTLDPISIALVQAPGSGSLSIDGAGQAHFMAAPSPDSSLETFSYTVEDSDGQVSNEATVFIQITGNVGGGGGGGGQQPPIANPDSATVDSGQNVQILVLNNDQAAGGATLDPGSVTFVTLPEIGSAQVNGQGLVTYIAPAVSEDTPASFSYTVTDSNGLVSNIAAITVQVEVPGAGGGGGGGGGGHGTGEAPRAVFDEASVTTGSSVDIDLVANDSDQDGDLDPDSILISQLPGQGTVLILGNGWVRYTPSVTSQSSDAFSYTVADDEGLRSNAATVGVTITDDGSGGGSGGGTAPTANYDSATATSGTSLVIDLTANDTDPDGDLDADSIAITQWPAHGVLEILSNGFVRYTTNLGHASSDTFNYTVSDNAGNVSNIATVGISIQ